MEQILCVPRKIFDSVGVFQGLDFNPFPYLTAFFNPANNLFLPRTIAEGDPSHKQIIPYAVITYGNYVLHYRRGGGSGEKRLVAKESIGFGGHLNPSDQDHLDTGAYCSLVLRELSEELDIPTPLRNRIVAVLNDDTTEVGRVHIGLVHHIVLPQPRAIAKEADIEEPVFRSFDDIRGRLEHLEGWSQILAAQLDQIVANG